MKVKICGLTRIEDIHYVNEVKPDYIGFVFAPGGRQVSLQRAAGMRRLLVPGIEVVGVFVNAHMQMILGLLQAGVIDIAQLHGQETEQDIRKIKEESGKPVIKAVKLNSLHDAERWQDTTADYLLFDSGSGSGQTFDWELVPKNCKKPFFLAGGLHAGNLTEACQKVTPYCVDVSTGVETDGMKDQTKIKQIIEIATKIT
jgi:phosphoribosylanthranilate isomerase